MTKQERIKVKSEIVEECKKKKFEKTQALNILGLSNSGELLKVLGSEEKCYNSVLDICKSKLTYDEVLLGIIYLIDQTL